MSEKVPDLISKIESEYGLDTIVWITAKAKEYHLPVLNIIKNNMGLLNYNDSILIHFMKENQIKYILSYDLVFDLELSIKRIFSPDFKLN